ncbi:MAG TPA: TIGR03435 family protein [Bryobacteraceae bacterium]|nr:TIGR03435 family protein [Bryobacteraceae bacterium]
MKKFLLWMIALAFLQGSGLLAQTLTGTWQGALEAPKAPGGQLRIVIKISTTDTDALKAELYSIDQGAGAMAGNVTLQASAIKIAVPSVAGSYEGRLSADASTIVGTWTQGPMPRPLNLKRATPETAWTIPEPPARPKPMAADANPTFEVATIKPSKPGVPGRMYRVNGRRFTTLNTSVSDLITYAYGVHPRQIAGGPPWMESQKYDVEAQPDGEGQPSEKQWKTMFEKLLAERFQLTIHHEQKELPVYAIVVGKTGHKLTKSAGDPNGLPGLFFRGLGVLPGRNATMADFAGVMQTAVLDRPVVDQTGLPGRYDFLLTWTPDETQFGGLGVKVPPPTDKADAPPDLFTAIQQELGLKLESTKASVDVLVVDKVEKPTEN